MTSPQTSTPDDTKPKVDLKPSQVAGAALGAATAAVAGSQIGTAGTLIGAAAASAIFTVSSALYRASLEQGREKVRALTRRNQLLAAATDRQPRAEHSIGTGSSTDPADPADPADPVERTERTERTGGTGPAGRAPQPDRPGLWRFASLRWGAVALGSVAAFVLAMMAITGFEMASGQTVGGKQGTTVGRVVDAPQPPRDPALPPVAPSSSAPPSESAIPSTTGTPTSPSPGSSSTAPTPTTTSTPDDGSSAERRPPDPTGTPTTTEVTPRPLLPPGLPGPGNY